MAEPIFVTRGLVRAVFVVSTGDLITSARSRSDAEHYGNIWAVGCWRRDDDPNLSEKLDKDFEYLTYCYKRILGNHFPGGVYTFEYKEYDHNY